MHKTRHSGPLHWDAPEGWVGREVGGGSGWGTHVHPWMIHVNVLQKPLQYCKVISRQLNKLIKKKRKTYPNFHVASQRTPNSQTILKKNQIRKLTFPDFKAYYKAIKSYKSNKQKQYIE